MNARAGSFYTDKNIHEIREMFLTQGMTVANISRKMNITPDTIYSYISDLMPLVVQSRARRTSSLDRQDIIDKMARGISNAKIAAPYGMSRQAVTMFLTRHPLTQEEQAFIDGNLKLIGKTKKYSKRV